MAAGLAVCLAAGTAQASPISGPDRIGTDQGRVVLKAPSTAAAAATLTLSSTAPLLVGGAAARVSGTYTCPTGTQGYLEVGLTEVTGNRVAQAYGANKQPLTCDGAAHTLKISVVVSNDYPLKKGKAFAQGFLYAFSETTEANFATERTITLT